MSDTLPVVVIDGECLWMSDIFTNCYTWGVSVDVRHIACCCYGWGVSVFVGV